MKRKYIKPTTKVFASIVQPMMGGVSGIDNSYQSDDGGAAARATVFMEDESEDSFNDSWDYSWDYSWD